MRIRFLAAAAVTTGALMTVLTGAASASGTPSPAESFESSGASELASSGTSGLAVPAVPATPPEGAVTIACRGGKGFVTRALTEAERERIRTEGRRRAGGVEVAPAVPALPADGLSEVRVAERGETVHPEGWDEVRVPGEAVRGKKPHGKPHCVKAFPGKGSCEVVKGRPVPVPRHGSSGPSGSFHSSGPEEAVRVRKLPGKPAVVCVSKRR
ncbi:hypothetical protein PS9374_04728 [Planomonospora sphaerica]|uniref:Uncharacterized protein n=1 Tax=Planomonospora sphaerica TaxID=161355 RepID=A0A171DJR5_9ACTN|nr:hypothetical protein [Planomonospora sphaerica]GAT69061.1 hypothetical protein PS9374_04728 [Planomonospora sphaerica]